MNINSAPRKNKKPWPTSRAMAQVYENNLWGESPYKFYSGIGSHDPTIVDPYIACVRKFLNDFEQPISVCDLGCGDFNVGKQLVIYAKKYIAVDIVETLVDFNRSKFQVDNLEFKCIDIAKDPLPTADCVIVRQVLQHLSNREVYAIVQKLKTFKYIIFTDHIPDGKFTPNIDIISGQGTRLKKNSGLCITASPFNFKVGSEEKLITTKSSDGNGSIVTTLYTNKK